MSYQYAANLAKRNPMIPTMRIKDVSMRIMSNDTIEKLSNHGFLLTEQSTFISDLGPAHKTVGSQVNCSTCKHSFGCDGHMGHLNFNHTFIHPFFITYVKYFLKMFCHNCSQYVDGPDAFSEQLRKTAGMYPIDRLKAMATESAKVPNKGKSCVTCHYVYHELVSKETGDMGGRVAVHNIFMMNFKYRDVEEMFTTKYADDIHKILASIDNNYITSLGLSIHQHPKNAIHKKLLVLPTTIRPSTLKAGTNSLNTDFLTSKYDALLAYRELSEDMYNSFRSDESDKPLRADNARGNADRTETTYVNAMVGFSINLYELLINASVIPSDNPRLLDPSKKKTIRLTEDVLANRFKGKSKIVSLFKQEYTRRIKASKNKASIIQKSIAERLPKKENIIRNNILGKRIHNMSRSVISCNPRLPLDTVMIAISFAKKLKTKEVVTAYNIDRVKKVFQESIDGIDYPRITELRKASGHKYIVSARLNAKVEIGDTIVRDIIDGDYVYFNRQPTLLYSNITAMKVVVNRDPNSFVTEFNVSIAEFFNADFDGDQMSVRSLENQGAAFEAYNLASVANFAISKQTSSSNIGQTYDGPISCFLSTRHNAVFSKDQASKAISYVINQPVLLKQLEEHFATNSTIHGRELMSMLIPKGINLSTDPAWYNKKYADRYEDSEKRLVIDNGIIKSGVLDGKSVDKKGNSIYRQIHYNYGGQVMLDTIFNMQQVGINLVENIGFSLSIADVVLPALAGREKFDNNWEQLMSDTSKLIEQYLNNEIVAPVGWELGRFFEDLYLTKISSSPTDISEFIDFDTNGLFQLPQTKTKGKMHVINQMIESLGQVTVNGRLPPKEFNRRESVYCALHEVSQESMGYCKSSYFNGIPVRHFLPAMQQSRQEILTKALSTAESGEQNRSSIKATETNVVTNSLTITNSQDIVQYQFGGDGIDIAKCIYVDMSKYFTLSDEEYVAKYGKYNLDFKHNTQKAVEQFMAFQRIYHVPEDVYKFSLPIDIETTINGYLSQQPKKSPIRLSEIAISDTVDKFNDEIRNTLFGMCSEEMRRLNSYRLCSYVQLLLCVNEVRRRGIDDVISLTNVIDILRTKIINSVLEPAVPIGILTAQCISEPITQKTLDTHHGAAQEGSKKTGMKRIKELIGSKKVSDTAEHSMYFELTDPTDKALAKQVAKYIETIEMSTFIDTFVTYVDKDIMKGDLTKLTNDADDKEWIKNFTADATCNYLPYNFRIVLDKKSVINKNTNMLEIVDKLRFSCPEFTITHTRHNSEKHIIRVFCKHITESFVLKQAKVSINAVIDKVYNTIRNVSVKGIPGIVKSNIITYVKNGTERYMIVTTGINLREIFLIENINHSTLQIDDMNIYNAHLGICATREKLMYELRETIDTSLHSKNYRLVVDNITVTGELTSFEKHGIDARERNHVLLRMGKSHPIQVLEEAAYEGSVCPTTGLTGGLMVGHVPNNYGTIMNKIMM